MQQVCTKHELVNKKERNVCTESCIMYYTNIIFIMYEKLLQNICNIAEKKYSFYEIWFKKCHVIIWLGEFVKKYQKYFKVLSFLVSFFGKPPSCQRYFQVMDAFIIPPFIRQLHSLYCRLHIRNIYEPFGTRCSVRRHLITGPHVDESAGSRAHRIPISSHTRRPNKH